jgi:transketolase
VLSKGHAALAWYAGLELAGVLGEEALDEFCTDGSRLAAHPDHRIPGVRFSTGSLGLGVSYAVGSALAARLRRSSRRTVVLASDAELNCGITWEALLFAAHHRLDRLQIVVDLNGSQAFGATHDVVDLQPLAPRLTAFGFLVDEIDGHDARQLRASLEPGRAPAGRPRVTLARCQLGRGVSFMAGRLEWHYLRMSDEQYRQALLENGVECDARS